MSRLGVAVQVEEAAHAKTSWGEAVKHFRK